METTSRPTLPAPPSASPSLPAEWIDRLFGRLHALYGKAWLDLWADAPMADVKDAWREALGPFAGSTIKAALDYCAANAKFPPSCPEFVGYCRSLRPSSDGFAKLSAPAPGDPDPRILAAIRDLTRPDRKRDPLDCFRRILADAEAGNYRSAYGLRMAKEALGIIPQPTEA